MNWLRTLGTIEYSFIGVFILLYISYIVRIFLIAKKMKSEMRSVFYKFFLRSIYFLLLIIALLGPSFGNVKKEIKTISKEIYIVLDLSLSMNSNDIQPSRILKAKREISNIIQSFPSDRIGIIGFTNSAFVISPPTYDKNALSLFLEAANPENATTTGSDIAAGLELALKEQDKFSKSGLNKIIVLITDGEDFGERTIEVTEQIRKKNIHLMILGVGSTYGSKIPFNGTYKRDKEGKIVVTSLNKELLANLSEEGDGYYFELSDNRNESKLLINRIKEVEGSVVDTKEVDASANKYLYFLCLALVLILLDILITIKTVQI